MGGSIFENQRGTNLKNGKLRFVKGARITINKLKFSQINYDFSYTVTQKEVLIEDGEVDLHKNTKGRENYRWKKEILRKTRKKILKKLAKGKKRRQNSLNELGSKFKQATLTINIENHELLGASHAKQGSPNKKSIKHMISQQILCIQKKMEKFFKIILRKWDERQVNKLRAGKPPDKAAATQPHDVSDRTKPAYYRDIQNILAQNKKHRKMEKNDKADKRKSKVGGYFLVEKFNKLFNYIEFIIQMTDARKKLLNDGLRHLWHKIKPCSQDPKKPYSKNVLLGASHAEQNSPENFQILSNQKNLEKIFKIMLRKWYEHQVNKLLAGNLATVIDATQPHDVYDRTKNAHYRNIQIILARNNKHRKVDLSICKANNRNLKFTSRFQYEGFEKIFNFTKTKSQMRQINAGTKTELADNLKYLWHKTNSCNPYSKKFYSDKDFAKSKISKILIYIDDW